MDMELDHLPDDDKVGDDENLFGMHMLGSKERRLLKLVEDGDAGVVEQYLRNNPGLKINSTDFKGRSALQIAVRNQHEEMIDLLLTQKDITMGDSLLFAIDEGNVFLVEKLLNWEGEHKHRLEEALKRDGPFESAEFPPHMTPLMYACICNHFRIVRLLIIRGHKIELQDAKKRSGGNKIAELCGETLEMSEERIDCYRALASPSYLCLHFSDPIEQAFHLSHRADELTQEDPVFKKEYEDLAEQLRMLAVNLLNECRTSEEVYILLNKESESGHDMEHDMDYPRLQMAMDYEQKEFITHPKCQQVLQNIWTQHHPDLMTKSFFERLIYFIPRILFLPFIYIGYFFLPWLHFWDPWKAPINKFMGDVVSYFVFLGVLIYTVIHGQYRVRVPNVFAEDIIVYLYIAGFCWNHIKLFWYGGVKAYIKCWWYIYDVVMLVLFITSFVARFSSWIQGRVHQHIDQTLERKYWPWDDPMLVSEAFYCIACVFAMGRVLCLFQMSQILGPVQLSLSRMMYDVMQMFFLFALTMFAFSMGMTRLYKYYDGSKRKEAGEDDKDQNDAFVSWGNSFKTLFWNLFGYGEVEYADVIVDNTYNSTHNSPVNKHDFIEGAGHILYGLYHIIMVTTLLNMLIAMMSNSLTHIQDNADREWKFARSGLWMTYFSRGSTLPPPFNILPSPKSVYRLILWIKLKVCGGTGDEGANFSINRCCYIETKEEKSEIDKYQEDYESTMQKLIRRYLHSQSSKSQDATVSPDDLEQLKMDLIREIQKATEGGPGSPQVQVASPKKGHEDTVSHRETEDSNYL